MNRSDSQIPEMSEMKRKLYALKMWANSPNKTLTLNLTAVSPNRSTGDVVSTVSRVNTTTMMPNALNATEVMPSLASSNVPPSASSISDNKTAAIAAKAAAMVADVPTELIDMTRDTYVPINTTTIADEAAGILLFDDQDRVDL